MSLAGAGLARVAGAQRLILHEAARRAVCRLLLAARPRLCYTSVPAGTRRHPFGGGIAQLGERLAGSQKVTGSSPVTSTNSPFPHPPLITATPPRATRGPRTSQRDPLTAAQRSRLWEIDALRGCAVLAMIVFHFAWDWAYVHDGGSGQRLALLLGRHRGDVHHPARPVDRPRPRPGARRGGSLRAAPPTASLLIGGAAALVTLATRLALPEPSSTSASSTSSHSARARRPDRPPGAARQRAPRPGRAAARLERAAGRPGAGGRLVGRRLVGPSRRPSTGIPWPPGPDSPSWASPPARCSTRAAAALLLSLTGAAQTTPSALPGPARPADLPGASAHAVPPRLAAGRSAVSWLTASDARKNLVRRDHPRSRSHAPSRQRARVRGAGLAAAPPESIGSCTGHDGARRRCGERRRHGGSAAVSCRLRDTADDVGVVVARGRDRHLLRAAVQGGPGQRHRGGRRASSSTSRDVTFIDSTALGVLVSGAKRVRPRNGNLDIVCTDENIIRIFEITGLDRIFGIYPPRARPSRQPPA